MRAILGAITPMLILAGVLVIAAGQPADRVEPVSVLLMEDRHDRLDDRPPDYHGERSAIEAATRTRVYRRASARAEEREHDDREPDREQQPRAREQHDEQRHHEPEPEPAQHAAMSRSAQVVAACESGRRLANGTAQLGTHQWAAHNPTSTASGAYQFLDGTWQRVARIIGATQYARAAQAPPAVQTAAFHALWAGGAGSSHWNASRACWGPML